MRRWPYPAGMCGRYAQLEGAVKAEYLEWLFAERDKHRAALAELRKRASQYDIRPTHVEPIFLSSAGQMGVADARWGWAREFSRAPLINCRLETVAIKPTFAAAYRSRRCVVPASAYYEWKRDERDRPVPRGKHAFRPLDGGLFLMAGLWEPVDAPNGPEPRFLVITRAMVKHAGIHDRTPVMLTPEAARVWVDPASSGDAVNAATASLGDDDLVVRPVCDGPNKARPAGPHLLESTGEPWPW